MGYFLPYQQRWIVDDSPLKIYEKSRRVGITYATSYRANRKCLREPQGSSFVQWVSSRDDLTAKEFITDYVAKWAKESNAIARGLDGSNVEVVDEKHGITAYVVRYNNGARICSLSSNPLAFAGKGGDILLDEMDLHHIRSNAVFFVHHFHIAAIQSASNGVGFFRPFCHIVGNKFFGGKIVAAGYPLHKTAALRFPQALAVGTVTGGVSYTYPAAFFVDLQGRIINDPPLLIWQKVTHSSYSKLFIHGIRHLP